LERLQPDDRAFFEPLVVPRWLLRRRRLLERDAAVRTARAAYFPDPRVTVAAKQIASALAAYAVSNGRREQHLDALPDGVSGRHRALHAVLRTNGGKVVAWRRIAEILGPARNCIAVEEGNADTEAAPAGTDRSGPILRVRVARADSARTAVG
jgi:hypothetical protein